MSQLVVVAVRFERVFDVQRRSLQERPCTDFSFEMPDGRKVYGVSVPGEPRIEAGMEVSAVLTTEGNWQTLIGWKDHATGAVVLPRARFAFIELLGPLAVATVFGLLGRSAGSAVGRYAAFGVAALGLLVWIDLLNRWRRNRRAARILMEL